ncbi:zinc finger BED domain-containing protein DAYSLEEPER-like isoform X1 [Cynara cardunculus var. scolymus]|uniref:zinc finger BED domain-containing protein DAYSLEEPER-like isoform X1 n=2 Tax=Cynara cardunculus var. scolymus TaxID=59895 RepID=UPI000D62F143|nr:zinc finger BED domain-containing protein DAYSLEEPER-like isoform X1 [Cynara cardunculus var. scolymus]XP_024968946.1 zinc finger BED domain-containing protein DAYSLEEPER-like isoform X1 [Cynara cardunculus var. scolymus]XP_024968947.1 zinc finger BED domain-containing protein DAYSLEEPER-like isoform X1 [Cynara cardunculus var. scolymus]XP_024968948.1 zinc finger BED domain-containing protein DAYSLEEPER-like isoform X1 [Cynara cardunculus var. scolymus]XP_024968949.1 zinc finger BED domain-c
MANPTNNSEPPNADEQMNNKRRRKKSIVWEHFTIETVDSGCTRARCMQCKKSFAYISGSKLAGTSHLKRHIALGICPVSRINQKNGEVLALTPHSSVNGTQDVNDLPRKRLKSTSGSNHTSFFQDRCRYDIAKMIIMHEYPLDMVECPAFLNSVRALQPQFPVVALDAIERDCVGLYQRERQTLLDLIGSVPGRVNLSLDMWSTYQSVGYAFITGQFIDDDWKLHRRILAVVLLPFPDSESAFNHAILSCISDWNLENKLFAVTLDESFANKAVRRNLRHLLSVKNPLILNGKLLIGSCYARVLGHLVQDALGSLRETVKKVRDSVKYVVTVDACQERFNDLKLQLQVPSAKSLVLDDQTQWNTTYHMLIAACELKEVFSCLDTFDSNYRITLTMDEWKQLDVLCTFLKLLLDAANLLTGPTYPTANAFFHEAWKIQLELKHAAVSDDAFIRNLTRPMHERFNRYWKDCSLVFSIAVVMDPRFKMKLVEFSFSRIYGEDADHWVKVVSDGVHDLFLDYVVQMLPPPTFVVNGDGGFLKTDMPEEETILHCEILDTEVPENEIFLSTSDELSDFDVYISGMTSHQNMKPELDQYLEESVLPRMQEFDVLGWWKLNRKKYPILSKMASDILCIPVSTVSQDSVFDITCKKMDRYRCSLRPSTVEALVCAKDWLQHGSSSSDYLASKTVVKMEL